MKVTISIDNGDQDIEVSRSSDVASIGVGAAMAARVLDQAATDVRAALGIVPATRDQRRERLASVLLDAERAFAGGTQLERAEHLARCVESAGLAP